MLHIFEKLIPSVSSTHDIFPNSYPFCLYSITSCAIHSMVRVQKRIQSGLKVLQYYTTKNWHFVNNNVKELSRKLDEKDKDIYFCDMSNFDWNQYLLNYVLGARRYCVHEEPDTIPRARRTLRK